MYTFLLIPPVLRIGFEPISYTVMEGNDATLCARVLSGNIGRDVPISFRTQDNTAQRE